MGALEPLAEAGGLIDLGIGHGEDPVEESNREPAEKRPPDKQQREHQLGVLGVVQVVHVHPGEVVEDDKESQSDPDRDREQPACTDRVSLRIPPERVEANAFVR